MTPITTGSEVAGGESSDEQTEARSAPVGITMPTPNQTPGLVAIKQSEKTARLLQPLPLPVRPFSPDTFSVFSTDEFEQLALTASHQSTGSAYKASHPAPSQNIRARLRQSWIRNKGIAFMLLAQIFGTLMNITTRVLELDGNNGKGLHPFQVLFVRMIITSALASLYMWQQGTPNFPLGAKETRSLLVARAIGGFFGVFGMYYSLVYLPLADATVITFLAPGLACWACSILIKEPFTRTEQMAALVSLVGVVLIARPTALFAGAPGDHSSAATGNGDAVLSANTTTTSTHTDNATSSSMHPTVTPVQRMAAVGIAFLGVLGSAVAYTTIRWIGQRVHPLITVNYFAVCCTIVSAVMIPILPGIGFALPANLKDWGLLLFLGICGFTMQFLLAAGLAYEKSSRATNMIYVSMLFALGGDKLIFGHTPGIMSIVGSSLILSSAVIVAIQKDSSLPKVEPADDDEMGNDEESQRALIHDVETGEDHERIPMENVQIEASSSRV